MKSRRVEMSSVQVAFCVKDAERILILIVAIRSNRYGTSSGLVLLVYHMLQDLKSLKYT
jgi:hypothetical protein